MCSTEISVAPDGTRPLEILEREITALTSEIHAATCRWLCLIAEYDTQDATALNRARCWERVAEKELGRSTANCRRYQE